MRTARVLLTTLIASAFILFGTAPAGAGSGPGGLGKAPADLVVTSEVVPATADVAPQLHNELSAVQVAAATAAADRDSADGVVSIAASASCGNEAGYYQVGAYALSSGTRWGTLYICWNGVRNSAVNYCYGNTCGVRLSRCVWVGVPPGYEGAECGQFYYYAGPVHSDPSAGQCIIARAYIFTNVGLYNSFGPFHCG